ncbi:MAG: AmmeMemoRadiSam system radical SAM enzyme, partial [Firmicutes bacterium]|nr:AmmeMemoRadiSam system radical SAM enzyme [Bacillota bacterium]
MPLTLREARWYEYDREGDLVRCLLCPQGCRLKAGQTGVCRVRRREGEKLFTVNYGRVTALALDPIEKKPLYHFHPGSAILSVGTFGCNLACGFCQNWRISQEEAPSEFIPPARLVALAERERAAGNIGLAYTYSEPSVWWEYLMDAAPLARERGLANVLVTNGYLNRGPLLDLLPYLDAVNMDLKGPDEFYRRICHGRLGPVQAFAEAVLEAGVHLELTNLIIPGYNDTEEDLRALVDWVAGLDPEIPLHFSRYFPQYRFTAPPTPLATMERAYELARARLTYVYLGNVSGPLGRDTFCPQCGELLIRREGYHARIVGLEEKACRRCGKTIR